MSRSLSVAPCFGSTPTSGSTSKRNPIFKWHEPGGASINLWTTGRSWDQPGEGVGPIVSTPAGKLGNRGCRTSQPAVRLGGPACGARRRVSLRGAGRSTGRKCGPLLAAPADRRPPAASARRRSSRTAGRVAVTGVADCAGPDPRTGPARCPAWRMSYHCRAIGFSTTWD